MNGVRGILFDFGGTLDAPGIPWGDRFVTIYGELGVGVSPDALRAAFGFGTREAYASPDVVGFGLQATVEFHVRCQLRSLGIEDAGLAAEIARRFLSDTQAALAESRAVLERLRRRFALGVVSNFYGNLDRILADAGLAPHLTAVLDSTVVGFSKPDPAVFALALERLGVAPAEALFVGDSLDKDIAPARRAGMRTAWLVGARRPVPADARAADATLATLADLERLLA